MSRLVVTLVAILCPAVVLEASAVVIFRTPERVIVAADSRVRVHLPNGAVENTQICKIQPSGRWWTATSGNTAGLDLDDAVTKAIRTAATLDEVKAALVAHVYPRVQAGLEAASASSGFQRLYPAVRRRQPVATVVVAGIEGPRLAVGQFFILLDTVHPFATSASWLTCPGMLCDGNNPEGPLHSSMGVKGPVIDRLTPPLASWVLAGDSAAARRIVREQIAATPDKAAGPIDVLELTPNGAQWIERDPASLCGR